MHTTDEKPDNYNKKICAIYPKMKYYALNLEHGNQENAEDLLHDTVIRIIEKIERFIESRSDNFTAWCMSIMHNLYIDKKRKENKERFRTRYISEIERFDYPQPFDEPRDVVMKEKFKLAKSRIKNEKHRELFIMRSFGLSYKEISKVINGTEMTVKTRIHQMKLELTKKPDRMPFEEEFHSYKEEFMNVLQRDDRNNIDFALMIVSVKKNVEVDRVRIILKPVLEELKELTSA